jgi:hypothetical protein
MGWDGTAPLYIAWPMVLGVIASFFLHFFLILHIYISRERYLSGGGRGLEYRSRCGVKPVVGIWRACVCMATHDFRA